MIEFNSDMREGLIQTLSILITISIVISCIVVSVCVVDNIRNGTKWFTFDDAVAVTKATAVINGCLLGGGILICVVLWLLIHIQTWLNGIIPIIN